VLFYLEYHVNLLHVVLCRQLHITISTCFKIETFGSALLWTLPSLIGSK